jgi:hypothetical protein
LGILSLIDFHHGLFLMLLMLSQLKARSAPVFVETMTMADVVILLLNNVAANTTQG